MVIHNLNVESIPFSPLETNAPLFVDPDAVLSLPIPLEELQLIRGRNHEIAQVNGTVLILQLLARPLLYLAIERPHELTLEYRMGVLVPEGSDHGITITLCVINVKR